MKKGISRRVFTSETREQVIRLYLQGHSQTEIAKRLGITQPTVAFHVKKVKELWKEKYATQWQHFLYRELAKIDYLESKYWEAFERAQENPKVVQEIRRLGRQKRLAEIVRRAEKDPGTGVEFLRGVQWCIEQRIALLGLKAPLQVNVNEKKDVNINVNENTDQTFKKLVRFIAAVPEAAAELNALNEQSSLPNVSEEPGTMGD